MPVLDLEVLETGSKLISGEIERAEVKGQSKEEQRSVFEKGVKTNPILLRNDAKNLFQAVLLSISTAKTRKRSKR